MRFCHYCRNVLPDTTIPGRATANPPHNAPCGLPCASSTVGLRGSALVDAIARLGADGPTSEEIDRGRVQAETQFMFRLQTVGGFGGKSDQLNAYNVFLKDPAYFSKDL